MLDTEYSTINIFARIYSYSTIYHHQRPSLIDIASVLSGQSGPSTVGHDPDPGPDSNQSAKPKPLSAAKEMKKT